MGVELLKHNQEAYEKVKLAITDGKKKIAIAHATGTGKSYLIAKLSEDFSNDKKLVLVPSTYISEQIKKHFEKYSIENIEVILYQKLIKMSDEDIAAMDYDVVALDEYHHDTSKVWGEKVRKLIGTHPESIIFGTSATPIRSDGVNTIDELFEGNCASDLPLSESIAKKIVPLPKYVGALYTLDAELEKLRKKIENATNTKEEKQEFYKKINTMRSQIEKSYGMPIILNKHITNREGKYIVFCKKKRHLREIKNIVIDWFKTAGFKNINAYEVYSDYENKDAEYKAFCNDASNSLKLLFCVNMLNEGLHLEDISGVLLLRPTRSMLVFLQQIGRAIEANNTNTPVIIDAVNNFSSAGQGMKLLGGIKEAVAKEKESNPNFDDSRFEDIDTFFVLEQVVEIQEMFAEIEGRLEGSWDLYIKALKQYKEREGDCDVPARHVEKIGEMRLTLGNWCNTMRQAKKGKGTWNFTKKMETQLNKEEFIWDVYRYRFEKNIEALSEYYRKYGKYPSNKSKDMRLRNLGNLINREKIEMRGEKYPDWKWEIVLKYLPDFSCETRWDKSFNEFVYYAKLYKDRFGHVQIKENETIESFDIGHRLYTVKKMYQDGRLTVENIRVLKELGVCLESKFANDFIKNMELARQAVKNGVIINTINQIYEGKNLYCWIHQTIKKKYKNEELSCEEIKIIEDLIGKSIDGILRNKMYEKKFILCKQAAEDCVILTESNRIYKGVDLVAWIKNHKKQFSDDEMKIINQVMSPCPQNVPVRINDIKNHICKEYISISEAGRALHNEFNVVESDNKGIKAISNRLTGIIRNPVYKDRFRFEYVDDRVS